MKVHVLGSSGTFPTAGRPASGYIIEQDSTRIWCDAGFGTYASIPFDPDLIDAVVISHQHPDHCADLAAAFHAWAYRPEPRHGIPLYAPQAVWDRMAMFLEKDENSDLPIVFDFHPVWEGDSLNLGDLSVSFTEMDHSVPTVGSRWEANGRSLFYTGDTGPGGGWTELLEGANILLTEASYQEFNKNPDYPHHLSAADAGTIARAAGVEKMYLTHIPPYMDPALSVHEAEQTFDRPVALATPGTEFTV